MKYTYSIYAEGTLNEDEIKEELSRLGLNAILVEKYINIESLIRDENSARDEKFHSKWEALLKSGIIPEKLQKELIAIYDGEEKSMQELGYLIQNVGINAGMSNSYIARLLQEVFCFMRSEN